MANTFKSYAYANIGTSAQLMTTSAGQVTVIGLSLANVSGSSITVDAYIVKGGTTAYIIKGAPVPAGGALVAVGGDQKIVLESGNTLYVKSNTATSLDAILSVLEIV